MLGYIAPGYGGFTRIDSETHFLTPLLNKGKWKLAQSLAKVDSQKIGIKFPQNVESYSGYLTINTEVCHSNLFFWYFPAEVRFLHTYNYIEKRMLYRRTFPTPKESLQAHSW